MGSEGSGPAGAAGAVVGGAGAGVVVEGRVPAGGALVGAVVGGAGAGVVVEGSVPAGGALVDSAAEHVSPLHPSWQAHVPSSSHRPWSEQFAVMSHTTSHSPKRFVMQGVTAVEHVSPTHPSWQAHVPSSSHRP